MPERVRHLCHAYDCETAVKPALFMCRKHWYMVPITLRRAIWAAYVPGQEERKDPSEEYLEVAQHAIDIVRFKEGK